MHQLIRVGLIGLTLACAGCSAETPGIAPAKDTKQEDEAKMKKMREESMNMNRGAGPSGEQGGEQKTP
jgi:hypothetical protein